MYRFSTLSYMQDWTEYIDALWRFPGHLWKNGSYLRLQDTKDMTTIDEVFRCVCEVTHWLWQGKLPQSFPQSREKGKHFICSSFKNMFFWQCCFTFHYRLAQTCRPLCLVLTLSSLSYSALGSTTRVSRNSTSSWTRRQLKGICKCLWHWWTPQSSLCIQHIIQWETS